jgi:protocatechuate 3,4-dioxygenase beta subunit
MTRYSRRDFLRGGLLSGAAGLAVLGTGILRADAAPTLSTGDPLSHLLAQRETQAPTEESILGPYYKPGAPFRGKLTPPLAEGTTLVIRGRVWGHDTKKPLPFSRLDLWQADAGGRYDNRGYAYRGRVLSDEEGLYEYETVHPGPYPLGRGASRPGHIHYRVTHIHYRVTHPGYETLVTQLYFRGDRHQKTDPFIKDSLVIELKKKQAPAGTYEEGTFDIVLSRAG